MSLWRSVCVTDPAAVKPITGKQYKGNSPKPYWIIQRATETFGPCGIGWGVNVVSERFERLTETDVLHVALVRVWYVQDGKTGELEQMGQTKASYRTAKGDLMVDEDAPKKSVTDGMVKCLWNVNPSDAAGQTEVSIVYEDGQKSLGTFSVTRKDGWLYVNGANFTYSSPTIKLKIKKQIVLKSITCVKGKLVKKVTASQPKCPAGYKQK